MRRLTMIGLTCAAIALQGCATMNESECLLSDWRAIGYEDGSRGAAPDYVANHRKACAKHGVALDMDSYRQGWSEGLRVYCQPQNGFNVGSRGASYNGTCPSDLEPAFAEAYQAGRHLHQLQSGVRSAESRIQARRNALAKASDERKAAEAELIADDTEAMRRIVLLNEIRELAEQQGKLETEIVELEREKAVSEERLESYRASLYYGYE